MMKDLTAIICFVGLFILSLIISGLISVAIYSSVMLRGNNRMDDYDFLREATNRFIASHEYKLNGTDKYTCVNYSRDYYLTMNNLGYNVKITGGCNETNCHVWNTIEIEPQRGFMKGNNYPLPLGPKNTKIMLSLME